MLLIEATPGMFINIEKITKIQYGYIYLEGEKDPIVPMPDMLERIKKICNMNNNILF